MKLTPTQIALYSIFITSILFILYYYTHQYTNRNESFTAEEDLTEYLTDELTKLKITDIGIQSRVINYVVEFSKLLENYKVLQVPITINNTGTICDDWGNYGNNMYKDLNNNCTLINGDNKCLRNNNLVSCSNYYNDDTINDFSKIDTEDILNDMKYKLFSEINAINSEINDKSDIINKLVNELIIQKNLEIQQKYFIDYNTKNLEDKKKNIYINNKEFEKSENDVNINKIQLQQNEKINKYSTNRVNTYYTIIIWLIVLLIIVGVLNFAFTELI